jgi:hypothetical protein
LRGGLPVIAFRDLAIQPRTNDLVCGTFGRGFYILDDYTPLRSLTNETLAQEGVLFPLRNASLFNELGYVRAAWGNETAPNPPFGAAFTYHLREALPADAKLVLMVSDASGKEIRQLSAPAKAGLQRITWDLRAEASTTAPGAANQPPAGGQRPAGAEPPSEEEAAMMRRFGRPQGRLVEAGKYKVVLQKSVGGVLTPIGAAQFFEVAPLSVLPALEKAGQ